MSIEDLVLAGFSEHSPLQRSTRWHRLPTDRRPDGLVLTSADLPHGAWPEGPILLLADAESAAAVPARVTVAPAGAWRSRIAEAWLERLVALREAAGLLRHDLYSPLAVIVGHLDLLGEPHQGPLNAKQRASVDALQRSCAKLEGELDRLGALLEGPLGLWPGRGRRTLEP